jgi:hypothetical protein
VVSGTYPPPSSSPAKGEEISDETSFFCWALILTFLTITVLVFAHEMTGWRAPEEAKKIKNRINATKASIREGKEIY